MYSNIVMDHFLNPRNVGTLAQPDVIGKAGSPGEGEYVLLHLNTGDRKITEARFQTYGCGPAIAACSCLTEWLIGKPFDEASALTPEGLSDLLGGLPPDKLFCAGLAVTALRNALEQCS
jgi:nitrogen fixation protein NifU and related proteins